MASDPPPDVQEWEGEPHTTVCQLHLLHCRTSHKSLTNHHYYCTTHLCISYQGVQLAEAPLDLIICYRHLCEPCSVSKCFSHITSLCRSKVIRNIYIKPVSSSKLLNPVVIHRRNIQGMQTEGFQDKGAGQLMGRESSLTCTQDYKMEQHENKGFGNLLDDKEILLFMDFEESVLF